MKPKVVILGARFPYPVEKGDTLRLYHHITEMAPHFRLFLICLSEHRPKEDHIEVIRDLTESVSTYVLPVRQRKLNVARHLMSDVPMQVRYFFDPQVCDEIEDEIGLIQPDHIHVHLLRMVPYISALPYDIPLTIDFMDSMTMNDLAGQYLNRGLARMLISKERKALKKYEWQASQKTNDRFIISERDNVSFQKEHGVNCHVLPNGVDAVYFKYQVLEDSKEFDVVFCGNLSYTPNIMASAFILEKLADLMPHIQFLIAGASPSDRLMSTQKKNVRIEGYQPDIRNTYYKGKIMIAPIFKGSGLQNKVLEAMACGTPCIVTSFVNEAIGAQVGKQLLIADSIDDFVLNVNDLISHPDKRMALSRSARKWVEEAYHWTDKTQKLIEVVKKSVDVRI